MAPKAAAGLRFAWHPQARLFDATGQAVARDVPQSGVIADQPAAAALSALGGSAFRIGGSGPAPAPAPEAVFETLTGGSSGAPRRIRRSQASWIASFGVNAGLFGIGPDSRVAILGQLVHSLALYGAVEALHLGAELHLLDGLRPDRQRAALAQRRVGLLYATPAQMRLLANARGPILSDLRVVLVGGSKLDPALRKALAQMAPMCAVHEFYGAAEASFITLAGPDTPEDSVGAPYPAVDLQVIDGEVWVKSPYLFEAYANDAGSARWQDGWLSVGERGALRDGQLYLSGRASRMVKVADQAVYPEEIETFLLSQAGVAQAAVLPRPDGLRGVHLVAVLQGDERQTTVILHALRAKFGALKAPKTLIWRDGFALLPSGKPDLVRLGEDLP